MQTLWKYLFNSSYPWVQLRSRRKHRSPALAARSTRSPNVTGCVLGRLLSHFDTFASYLFIKLKVRKNSGVFDSSSVGFSSKLRSVMNKLTRPPVIGITTFNQNEHVHYHLASTYVEAVRSSGGLPILLPPDEPDPAAILEFVDGLIFSGGEDLDPATYNGSLHPSISNIDPKRDAFELTLAREAINTDIPVLGICRGIGVLSALSGGSLLPHIPDEFGEVVAHTGEPTQSVKHLVRIEPESRLAQVIGSTEITVVSSHHQAVRTVPLGWRISAYALDGVIEALEHEHHPWAIALQWHPELAIDDPLEQRIFQALVEAASARNIKNKNKYFSIGASV